MKFDLGNTNIFTPVCRLWNHFQSNSLFRNAVYLMLSTMVMAFFGFFFWVINARLFNPQEVGIGTTLISVMALISNFSLFGLGNGLIRYLPTSERKNRKINTAFTLVCLTSLIISIVYLLFIKSLSPSLTFIQNNLSYTILFIFFIIFMTFYTLVDSIFIAYRSTAYVLLKNSVWSIAKVVLPVFLISFGAFGIFLSVGVATILSFVVSLWFLIWRFKFHIHPVIDIDILKNISRFSFGMYIAVFINGLPSMALPILITNTLGTKYSAFFYIALMIANLLFIIPQAVTQSLFAEGSLNEKELIKHAKNASKIIAILLIPATAIVILFGKYILIVFGKEYSAEGFRFLQTLSLSGIFMSINLIFGTIFTVRHKINQVIAINILGTVIILATSYAFLPKGLVGIGLSWIIGNATMCFVYMVITFRKKKSFLPPPAYQ